MRIHVFAGVSLLSLMGLMSEFHRGVRAGDTEAVNKGHGDGDPANQEGGGGSGEDSSVEESANDSFNSLQIGPNGRGPAADPNDSLSHDDENDQVNQGGAEKPKRVPKARKAVSKPKADGNQPDGAIDEEGPAGDNDKDSKRKAKQKGKGANRRNQLAASSEDTQDDDDGGGGGIVHNSGDHSVERNPHGPDPAENAGGAGGGGPPEGQVDGELEGIVARVTPLMNGVEQNEWTYELLAQKLIEQGQVQEDDDRASPEDDNHDSDDDNNEGENGGNKAAALLARFENRLALSVLMSDSNRDGFDATAYILAVGPVMHDVVALRTDDMEWTAETYRFAEVATRRFMNVVNRHVASLTGESVDPQPEAGPLAAYGRVKTVSLMIDAVHAQTGLAEEQTRVQLSEEAVEVAEEEIQAYTGLEWVTSALTAELDILHHGIRFAMDFAGDWVDAEPVEGVPAREGEEAQPPEGGEEGTKVREEEDRQVFQFDSTKAAALRLVGAKIRKLLTPLEADDLPESVTQGVQGIVGQLDEIEEMGEGIEEQDEEQEPEKYSDGESDSRPEVKEDPLYPVELCVVDAVPQKPTKRGKGGKGAKQTEEALAEQTPQAAHADSMIKFEKAAEFSEMFCNAVDEIAQKNAAASSVPEEPDVANSGDDAVVAKTAEYIITVYEAFERRIVDINENGAYVLSVNPLHLSRSDSVLAQIVGGLVRNAVGKSDAASAVTAVTAKATLVSLDGFFYMAQNDFVTISTLLVDHMSALEIPKTVLIYTMPIVEEEEEEEAEVAEDKNQEEGGSDKEEADREKQGGEGNDHGEANGPAHAHNEGSLKEDVFVIAHELKPSSLVRGITILRRAIAMTGKTADSPADAVQRRLIESFLAYGSSARGVVKIDGDYFEESPAMTLPSAQLEDGSRVCVGDIVFGMITGRALAGKKPRQMTISMQKHVRREEFAYLNAPVYFDSDIMKTSSVDREWAKSMRVVKANTLVSALGLEATELAGRHSATAGVSTLETTRYMPSVFGGRFYQPYGALTQEWAVFFGEVFGHLYRSAAAKAIDKKGLPVAAASEKISVDVESGVMFATDSNGAIYGMKVSHIERLFGSGHGKVYVYLARNPSFHRKAVSDAVDEEQAVSGVPEVDDKSFMSVVKYGKFSRYEVNRAALEEAVAAAQLALKASGAFAGTIEECIVVDRNVKVLGVMSDSRADDFAGQFCGAVKSVKSFKGVKPVKAVSKSVLSFAEGKTSAKARPLSRTDTVFAQFVNALIIKGGKDVGKAASLSLDEPATAGLKGDFVEVLADKTESFVVSVENFFLLKNILVDSLIAYRPDTQIKVYHKEAGEKQYSPGLILTLKDVETELTLLRVSIAAMAKPASGGDFSAKTRNRLISGIVKAALKERKSEYSHHRSGFEEGDALDNSALVAKTSDVSSESQNNNAAEVPQSMIAVGDIVFGVLLQKDFRREKVRMTGSSKSAKREMNFAVYGSTMKRIVDFQMAELASIRATQTAMQAGKPSKFAGVNSKDATLSVNGGLVVVKSNVSLFSPFGQRLEASWSLSSKWADVFGALLGRLWDGAKTAQGLKHVSMRSMNPKPAVLSLAVESTMLFARSPIDRQWYGILADDLRTLAEKPKPTLDWSGVNVYKLAPKDEENSNNNGASSKSRLPNWSWLGYKQPSDDDEEQGRAQTPVIAQATHVDKFFQITSEDKFWSYSVNYATYTSSLASVDPANLAPASSGRLTTNSKSSSSRSLNDKWETGSTGSSSSRTSIKSSGSSKGGSSNSSKLEPNLNRSGSTSVPPRRQALTLATDPVPAGKGGSKGKEVPAREKTAEKKATTNPKAVPPTGKSAAKLSAPEKSSSSKPSSTSAKPPNPNSSKTGTAKPTTAKSGTAKPPAAKSNSGAKGTPAPTSSSKNTSTQKKSTTANQQTNTKGKGTTPAKLVVKVDK